MTAEGPADLLRPEHRAFPLRPRPELEHFLRWCHSPRDNRVRLLTGPAGAGKTRLAIELAIRLRRDGGAVEFRPTAAPGAGAPTLLVIDEAESRPAEVRRALRALAAGLVASAGLGAPVRLLLLARSG